mmetsp:Transcript_40468/g.72417  ORF Transcript_40468/g.72417 Transcript_40468/m.72417 type:complete len:443 (+) Transcript_40468:1052-2380(+)
MGRRGRGSQEPPGPNAAFARAAAACCRAVHAGPSCGVSVSSCLKASSSADTAYPSCSISRASIRAAICASRWEIEGHRARSCSGTSSTVSWGMPARSHAAVQRGRTSPSRARRPREWMPKHRAMQFPSVPSLLGRRPMAGMKSGFRWRTMTMGALSWRRSWTTTRCTGESSLHCTTLNGPVRLCTSTRPSSNARAVSPALWWVPMPGEGAEKARPLSSVQSVSSRPRASGPSLGSLRTLCTELRTARSALQVPHASNGATCSVSRHRMRPPTVLQLSPWTTDPSTRLLSLGLRMESSLSPRCSTQASWHTTGPASVVLLNAEESNHRAVTCRWALASNPFGRLRPRFSAACSMYAAGSGFPVDRDRSPAWRLATINSSAAASTECCVMRQRTSAPAVASYCIASLLSTATGKGCRSARCPVARKYVRAHQIGLWGSWTSRVM